MSFKAFFIKTLKIQSIFKGIPIKFRMIFFSYFWYFVLPKFEKFKSLILLDLIKDRENGSKSFIGRNSRDFAKRLLLFFIHKPKVKNRQIKYIS